MAEGSVMLPSGKADIPSREATLAQNGPSGFHSAFTDFEPQMFLMDVNYGIEW